jgi:hypothetical protein
MHELLPGPLADPLLSTRARYCMAVVLAAVIPAQPQAPAHPLMPVIRMAEQGLKRIDSQIRDYTCILVKQEQIDGALTGYQYLLLKLRHRQQRDGQVVVPFSVYIRYLQPPQLADREVVYVEGRNKGKMVVRRGGERFAYVTTSLDPRNELAMREAHYPVTEVGIRNMIVRLLEVAQEDLHHQECQVSIRPGAKIDGRSCTYLEVKHPVRRDYFRYCMAQVFIDDRQQLPIRYASYDWPEREGGQPVLIEEYTFRDIRLNVGLTDADFDYRNEHYGFRKDYEP